jgi:hypothetical protein
MTQGLLGGFIGALLMALIHLIADIIKKKQEHEYSLKKSFFERKLLITETAISQRYIISSCLKSLAILFGEISKHKELIINSPPEFLKNYYESVARQIARLSDPSFDAAFGISLYFDLDEKSDNSSINEFMDLMMSIYGRHEAFNFFMHQYAITQSETEKTQIVEVGMNLLNQLQEDTKKLSDKMEDGSNQILDIIKNIRTQMKRFDS